MKRLSVILIVTLLSLSVSSQEKLILSDSFKVNTNNWPLVSKKNMNAAMGKEISSTGAYMIENMTKEVFITLIPSLPAPEKDFRITISLDKGFIEPAFKKDQYLYNEGFGIVFGAKDEQNFFVFQILRSGNYQMARFENGKQKAVLSTGYSRLLEKDYGNKIEISSENDRWKVFAGIQKEIIVNVPATPLLGNKLGFRAGPIEDWYIKYLAVYEKEKKEISAISKLIAALNTFPAPAFHTVFPDVLCDMFNRFRDIMDKPRGKSTDSTWDCTKRIPGFGPVTIQHFKDFSDLGCVVRFKKMDDAIVYFDEAAASIAATPGACFTLVKYTPDYQLNKYLKSDRKKYAHWITEKFRDPETGMVFSSIIELCIPNSLGDNGDVEFHIFLLLEKK
jgi:hypothetical protein